MLNTQVMPIKKAMKTKKQTKNTCHAYKDTERKTDGELFVLIGSVK